jgi:predicted ATP-binding protein involved in virulence
MRVKKVSFKGFRGLGELSLSLDQSATVLVGSNGTGKSAVLAGIAILLSRLPDHVQRTIGGRKTGSSRALSAEDVTNWESRAELAITVEHDGELFEWTRSAEKTLRGRAKEGDEGPQARALAQRWLPPSLTKLENISIPLAVIYPTNRAVLDVPLRIRVKHAFDQLDGWSLHAGESQFRLFFEWFRDREDAENEQRLRASKSYRDPQLQAVRAAVARLVPGLERLRVERSPLRMLVTKEGKDVAVDQLSDGEKCMLAMVADLARRLALANPKADPLKGEGIVLIDEVELHLHPAWQRTVVADLRRAFPNCQLILSTHSPQVLGDVKPESIFLLRRAGKRVEVAHPAASFGRDSNQILEELMRVPERRKATKEALEALFAAIDLGDLATANKLRSELEAEIGSTEPEFAKADILIRRQELKRAADHKAP